MNRDLQFLAKQDERWQRLNLSRIVAVTVGLLALLGGVQLLKDTENDRN